MSQHIQNILRLIQYAVHLSDEERTVLSKAVNAVEKELEITSFKLQRTEKVKHTTAILLEETIEELEQKRKSVEIQNRELEIEAALEWVRARTMAMQKSEELPEAANILFQQMQSLGVPAWSAGYCIWDKDKQGITLWMSSEGVMQPSFHAPLTEDPSFIHMKESYERGDDFHVEEVGGDELVSHYQYMRKLPVVGEILDSIISAGHPLPVFQIIHCVYFEHGFLLFITYEPVTECHEIFRRFGRVFEQTYTRFLDLQQAEARTREAKIEAALERTRTQSMLMQHSKQLDETLRIFHEQVLLLNIKSEFSFLWLPDEKNDRHIFWAAWAENDSNEPLVDKGSVVFKSKAIDYPLDRNEPATAQCLVDWNGKEPVVSYHVPPNGVEAYFTAWQELFAGVEQLRPECYSDGLYYVEAFMKYGCFGVMVKNELSAEERQILLRFAIEFERTYTRFLGLQKAEANAMEARIEASLERIRSRAMAMRNTEELLDAADLVGKELTALGIESMNVSYAFLAEDQMSASYYSVNPIDGKILPFPFVFPHTETEVMRSILLSWKNQEPLNIQELDEESTLDCQTWIGHHIRDLFDKKGIAFSIEEFLKISPKKAVISTFNFTYGYLFSIRSALLSELQKDILLRVTKVFDLTYRRFLDLKQAEAQAREAKIEAALERVRSRSMGMQKSEELKEVIQVVYEQFVHLNIHIEHTGFVIDYKTRDDYNIWIADPLGVPSQITVPHFDSVYYNRFKEAREKGEDFFATNLNFEEKNRFYQKLFEYVPGLPEELKEFYFGCPGLAVSTVLLDNICLYIENFSGIPYSNEENATLMRFGKVFQQTYTRFLDLQKAEAMAREAQIESALEKVRSRSLAMYKSEELQEVVNTVYDRLVELGIKMDSANFAIYEEGSRDMDLWLATSNASYTQRLHIPYIDLKPTNMLMDARDKGLDFIKLHCTFEEKNKWFQYAFEHSDLKYSPPERKKIILESKFWTASWAIEKHCAIQLNSYSRVSFSENEEDILRRFTKIFEQAYTRFLDLQKAETQALEAVKRASVDRVRAEIASMRTTGDLDRITPLIWNELTTLGVPFFRCGVFIMDEEQEQVNTYLSNPNGEAIAAFHQAYNAPGEIAEIVKSWRKKEMYTEHWNEARFAEFTSNLVQQGAITSGEKYLTENRPSDLYLHFLPFLQGMFYVGNTEALSDEALQLVQNLADAFSTAYARYEDFNKLEAAKVQVDRTLADLKLTQAQLVQAEKMASLGELTAGIAHEIQNPLNFVNNFSELSNELIGEMEEEMEKGNRTEAKKIVEDIRSNLEKINQHGKRADAIVKGMLQHSRTTSGEKMPTDINALADEYLRLAYHGLRAKDKAFNATLETHFDQNMGKISIIPQDIGRVLLNLISNAFYAVDEKKKSGIEHFEPTVSISTNMMNGSVELMVKDNGNGIPQKVLDKIFQPFFTTKPTGQGTGLGLSMAYDIVKAHGGEIKVETKDREGSCFTISIPFN